MPRQMAPSQRRRRRSAVPTASGRNTRQRLLQPTDAACPSLDCGSERTSQAASCGVDGTAVPQPSTTNATLAAAAAATAVSDGVPLASSQIAARPLCLQPATQPDEAGPASGTRSGTLRRTQSGSLQTQHGSAALQLPPTVSNVATSSHPQGEVSDGASPLQQGNGGTGAAATASRPLSAQPGSQLAAASEQHRQPDSAPQLGALAAAEPGSSDPNGGADASTPLPATNELSALRDTRARTQPQVPPPPARPEATSAPAQQNVQVISPADLNCVTALWIALCRAAAVGRLRTQQAVAAVLTAFQHQDQQASLAIRQLLAVQESDTTSLADLLMYAHCCCSCKPCALTLLETGALAFKLWCFAAIQQMTSMPTRGHVLQASTQAEQAALQHVADVMGPDFPLTRPESAERFQGPHHSFEVCYPCPHACMHADLLLIYSLACNAMPLIHPSCIVYMISTRNKCPAPRTMNSSQCVHTRVPGWN